MGGLAPSLQAGHWLLPSVSKLFPESHINAPPRNPLATTNPRKPKLINTNPKPEARRPKLPSPALQSRNPKPEASTPKPEAHHSKPQARKLRLQHPNIPEAQSPNPNLEIPNPYPKARNAKRRCAFDESSFFNAIEVNQPMLISPIMMVQPQIMMVQIPTMMVQITDYDGPNHDPSTLHCKPFSLHPYL